MPDDPGTEDGPDHTNPPLIRPPAADPAAGGPAVPVVGGPAVPVVGPPLPARFEWRVSPRLTAVKVAGALLFALGAILLRGDLVRTGFSAIAALVVAVYAIRDLIAPVRLAADPTGLTAVTGFAARRRLSWPEIELVRVDARRRLGTRSEFLEIDTGEDLHLFSGYDLGVPCAEVAEVLYGLGAPRSPAHPTLA
jgi:hypothetical protein